MGAERHHHGDRSGCRHTGARQTTIALCVEDGAWCRSGWATDGAGVYRAEVSPGTSYAHVGNGGWPGVHQRDLPDILCPGDCPPATALQSGVPLVVTAGGTLRADLNLDRGGIIAGTVTDARTSAPIAGLSVIVHLLIEGGPVPAASASTDASGRYVIQGLPAGRYYAHTYDPSTAYVNADLRQHRLRVVVLLVGRSRHRHCDRRLPGHHDRRARFRA